MLRKDGDAVVAKLMATNREHLATAGAAAARLGVPSSVLVTEARRGNLIAYRPPGSKETWFPLEQFTGTQVAPWVPGLIRAVGNGASAVHFLYARRADLSGSSFAKSLRQAGRKNLEIVETLVRTAASIAAD